jgi:uncharacterized protein (DUF1330 family)
MAAYLIITATVHDRAAFMRDYAPAAAALVARDGGRYVLRAPDAELLEGSVGEGASVVISEWPDKAAALAFWNSPDYAEAKRLRAGLADVHVLLIEAAAIGG